MPRGERLPIKRLVVVKLISENIDSKIQLSHNQCRFFAGAPTALYSCSKFEMSASNSVEPVLGSSAGFSLILVSGVSLISF